MEQPTEKICRAIVNLSENPQWAVFAEWIKDSSLGQSVRNNSLVEIAKLYQGQGRALELADLHNHLIKVKSYLQNYENKSTQRPTA